MTIAPVESASSPNVVFAGYNPRMATERLIAAEVWISDVVGAPWASKEAMKIAAFMAKSLGEGGFGEIYMKDIESRYNIQQGEITMALNLLQTFRAVEGYVVERGQLKARLRLGVIQQIRVREELARLAKLDAADRLASATAESEAALAQAAEEMRAALADEAA